MLGRPSWELDEGEAAAARFDLCHGAVRRRRTPRRGAARARAAAFSRLAAERARRHRFCRRRPAGCRTVGATRPSPATRSSRTCRLRCRCRRAGLLRFARSSRRRAPFPSNRTKLRRILPSIDGSCSRCRTRQHGPEKRHECLRLAPCIARVCAETSAGAVVDLGSGLGYLSHLLAFHHGLKSSASRRARRTPPARRRAPARAAKMRPGRDAAADALTCEPCDSADETDVAEADGEGAAAHVASVSDGASGGSFSSVRWRLPVDTGRAALLDALRPAVRQRRLVLVGLHASATCRRRCAASPRAPPTTTRWPASSASAAATTA